MAYLLVLWLQQITQPLRASFPYLENGVNNSIHIPHGAANLIFVEHFESSWHLESSPKCYLLVIFKVFVSSAQCVVGGAINI